MGEQGANTQPQSREITTRKNPFYTRNIRKQLG